MHIAFAVLLFSALCLLSAQIVEEDIQTIEIGKDYFFQIEPRGTGYFRKASKYFSLTINEKIDNRDLSFVVKPPDFESDPNIYISSKLKYPSSYENAQYGCFSYGMDICIIGHENITSGQTFYIGIECAEKCSFHLRVAYSAENFYLFQKQEGTKRYTYENVFVFSDDSPLTFVMGIPEDQYFERIEFDASYQDTTNSTKGFELYVKKGNDPPTSSNYDFKAITNWFQGKSVMIDILSSKDFCTGCNFTLVIHADMGSIIKFNAQISEKNKIITAYEMLNDLVLEGEVNTYECNILDIWLDRFNEKTMFVMLTVFSGDPDIYVHYDTEPQRLKDYKWNSETSEEEEIVITPSERKEVNASNKKFFIAVKGKTSAAYSIFIATSKWTKSGKFLRLGITESGSILKNEIVSYRTNIFGDKSFNVTVNLVSLSGNADIYLKFCEFNVWDCEITLDEISNRDELLLRGIFFYSDDVGPLDSFTFFHNATRCASNIPFWASSYDKDGNLAWTDQPSEPGEDRPWRWPFWSRWRKNNKIGEGWSNCPYSIGVVGKAEGVSKYRLTTSWEQLHIPLQESFPAKGKLEFSKFHYYKYYQLPDSSVSKIAFQITSISGEAALFASKTNERPNETDHDVQTKYSDDSISFINYNADFQGNYYRSPNADLSGIYYLSVKGISAASYLLSVIVAKSEGGSHKVFTDLFEGIPQFVSYEDPKTLHYFRFTINLLKQSNPLLRIKLQPIFGDFIMYIKTGDSAPKKDIDYSTYLKDVTLSPIMSSFQFDPNSTYTIWVCPENLEGDLKTPGPKKYSYHISYSTKKTIVLLTKKGPFYGVIYPFESLYFKFEIQNDSMQNKYLKIKLSTFGKLSFGLSLYLSFSSDESYPGVENNDLVLQASGSDLSSLILNSTVLNKKCPYYRNSTLMRTCLIFLGLESSEETKFSLSISELDESSDFSFQELTDGVPIRSDIPPQEKFLYFSYKIPGMYSTVISIYSDFVRFKAYAKVVSSLDMKLGDQLKQRDFPQVNDYEFYGSTSLSSGSIYIEREVLLSKNRECFNKSACVVLLSVTRFGSELSSRAKDSKVIIEASSRVEKIMADQMYLGFVSSKAFVYYSFEVDNDMCLLSIKATPLTGDPDLVISYGGDRRPTLDFYHWGSRKNGGELIKIEKNPYSKGGTMKGTYIIGVFGSENSTFYISAGCIDQKTITQIFEQVPLHINLDNGSPKYFKFTPNENKAFSLQISKMEGTIDKLGWQISHNLSVAFQDLNTNWNECSSTYNCEFNENFIKESKGYVFVFKLLGAGSQFIVQLNQKGGFIELKSGQFLSESVESFEEKLYSFTSPALVEKYNISVLVLSGDVVVYVSDEETISKSFYKITGKKDSYNHIYINFDVEKAKLGAFTRNKIYILVYGLNPSKYFISASATDETKKIFAGIPLVGTIPLGDSLIMEIIDGNQNPTLSCTLKNDNPKIKSLPSFLFYENSVKSSNILYYSIQSFLISEEQGIRSYVFNVKSQNGGRLFFEIRNGQPLTGNLNYNILLHDRALSLLQMGAPFVLHPSMFEKSEAPQRNIFLQLELTPAEGYLYINLESCAIQNSLKPLSQVKVASKYEYLKNGVFDINVDYLLEKRLGKIEIASTISTIFIAITPQSGGAGVRYQPQFILTSFFKKTEHIPYSDFRPGADGLIKYHYENSNRSLIISFHRLWCEESSCSYYNKKYTPIYDLYLYCNQEEDTQINSPKCGALEDVVHHRVDYSEMNEEIFVIFDSNRIDPLLKKCGNNLLVYLDASLREFSATAELPSLNIPFVYKTTYLNINSAQIDSAEVSIKTVIGVFLLLMVVLLGFAFYFYRRYKISESKLHYETVVVRELSLQEMGYGKAASNPNEITQIDVTHHNE